MGCFSTCIRAFEKGLRAVGAILSIFCCSMIFFVGFVWIVEVVPKLSRILMDQSLDSVTEPSMNIEHMFLRLLLWFVSIFCLLNTYLNFFACMFTSPGKPPLAPLVEEEGAVIGNSGARSGSEAHSHPIGIISITNNLNNVPSCRRCKRIRPPRTHHCSVCGTCVLKLDHHCPWVNTCVGLLNYHYFLLFLFWLLVTGVCFVACAHPVISKPGWGSNLNRGNSGGASSNNNNLGFLPFNTGSRESVMFAIMLAVSAVLGVGGLGGFHLYLVCNNQTTIESGDSFSSFSRGGLYYGAVRSSKWDNVKEVCGDKFIGAFFPVWILAFNHGSSKILCNTARLRLKLRDRALIQSVGLCDIQYFGPFTEDEMNIRGEVDKTILSPNTTLIMTNLAEP